MNKKLFFIISLFLINNGTYGTSTETISPDHTVPLNSGVITAAVIRNAASKKNTPQIKPANDNKTVTIRNKLTGAVLMQVNAKEYYSDFIAREKRKKASPKISIALIWI